MPKAKTPEIERLQAQVAELEGRLSKVAAEWTPLDMLVPWEANPRAHEVEKIAGSFRRFGFGSVLLARRANHELIAGHGRRAAIKLILKEGARVGDHPEVQRFLQQRELPVRWMDLSEGEAHAYALADNNMGGSYEDKPLRAALRELRDQNVPLTGLGWDDADLAELLKDEGQEPGGDPEPAQPPKKADSQPGTIYELGPHRLLCGDSTRDMEFITRLFSGGALARLTWTDPPYGVAYESKGAKEKKVIQNDNLTAVQTEELARDALKVAAAMSLPGAAIYVASPSGELLPHFIAAFKGTGYSYKHCLVWVKDVFVLARSDYHYRHESILYGWKEDAAHFFVDDRTHDSVRECPRPRKSEEHPTMKPVELVEYYLLNSTRRSEVVYDPFGGSGSTLIACARQGRTCRTVELDRGYCDVIRDRWTRYAESVGVDPGPGALRLPARRGQKED